ncbi:Uncharacterised protein [Legionella beliardensis]|uniref:Uncharacterized protein n=1 Tax=Legionella beliardensis TaxID=91822 RepID=A0A378HZ51_9GAMM|nr:hypothetical protein [Legionella beliardensis]STX28023.1 Uncharacterised protein [Legionella beliardensis]
MKQSWLKKITCLASATLFSGLIYSLDELRLNEGLPIMVDSKTELNDIFLKDDTVIFTYQIKNINVDQALQIKEGNKDMIEQNACEDEQIQELFCKDFHVNFIYWINDKKILEVPVNKDLCRARQNSVV